MKGILLISHGKMAEGVYHSLTMFFGEEIEQVDYLGLALDDGPELFKNSLEDKIEKLDKGDGIIVFADLLGGTPANISAHFAKEEIQVITGMNLPMVMESLGDRSKDVDIDHLIESGQKSMISINDFMSKRK